MEYDASLQPVGIATGPIHGRDIRGQGVRHTRFSPTAVARPSCTARHRVTHYQPADLPASEHDGHIVSVTY